MASSRRVKQDENGMTLIPMNIDTQYDTTSFMTIPKLLTLAGVILCYIIVGAWGKSSGFNILGWIVTLGLLTFVSQYIIRKIVFQENYFYKQWKEKLSLGKPKVTHFWNIPYSQKTSLGDVLIFSDLRMAVVVELEKDTIVGTSETNKEEHLDAWSEFYRSLFKEKLGMVQMNLMQPTGRDERFDTVAEEVRGAENPNIRKMLTMSLGHLRTLSNSTLDEHECILIYSKSAGKAEDLIKNAIVATEHLLSGSYRSARVLSESEAFKFPRWNFNVMYFDGVEAQLGVYRNTKQAQQKQLEISAINFDSGERIELTDTNRRRLVEACKMLDTKEISYMDWDVKVALEGGFATQSNVENTEEQKKVEEKVSKFKVPEFKFIKRKKAEEPSEDDAD